MAYNNGFPVGYQPYYMPQQQMYQAQPQITPQQMTGTQMSSANQQNSSIIWVQGEAGAKSYLVAPNNTVQLWDSESQTIYLKSADASGMPSMKILDYKFRSMEQPQVAQQAPVNNNYVTLDEVNAVKKELSRIKDELKTLAGGADHDE